MVGKEYKPSTQGNIPTFYISRDERNSSLSRDCLNENSPWIRGKRDQVRGGGVCPPPLSHHPPQPLCYPEAECGVKTDMLCRGGGGRGDRILKFICSLFSVVFKYFLIKRMLDLWQAYLGKKYKMLLLREASQRFSPF